MGNFPSLSLLGLLSEDARQCEDDWEPEHRRFPTPIGRRLADRLLVYIHRAAPQAVDSIEFLTQHPTQANFFISFRG
jgi:hypothetical protein